jgi:hypothetical protein
MSDDVEKAIERVRNERALTVNIDDSMYNDLRIILTELDRLRKPVEANIKDVRAGIAAAMRAAAEGK